MRHLLQPRALNIAAIAAGVSALACYPRMAVAAALARRF